MSWAKLDDKLHSHPKVLDAGLEGMGLWVLCLSYCADYLTDGFVSRKMAFRIGGESTERAAAALVEAGLWIELDSGWQFKDYLRYNPSSDREKRKREVDSERKRKGNTRERPSGFQTDSRRIPSGIQTESFRNPDGKFSESARIPDGFQTDSSRPVPDPVPITKTDPPLPPSGGVAHGSGQPSLDLGDPSPPAPRQRPAHGLLGTLARAYGDGVRMASGAPFVDPHESYDLRALKSACEAHCGAANTMEAQAWLTASAAEYRKAMAADAKYQSGFAPSAWVKWLQAGKPKASEHAAPQPANEPISQARRTPFVPAPRVPKPPPEVIANFAKAAGIEP